MKYITFFLKTNFKLIRQFKFEDIFMVFHREPYWRIVSVSMRLHGFNKSRLSKYRNGLRLRLEDLVYKYGCYREFTVNKNDLVVDIGANIGEFSLYCLQKGAKVLSIEPDENIYPCTLDNLKNYSNSIGIEKAVISEINGTLDFYQAPHNADSSTIQPVKFFSKVKVTAMTLDHLYEKYNLGVVDLIKCDAEGAEPEVLKSAYSALARTKKVTFNCGPERKGDTTVNEVVSILEANDFTTKVIDGYLPKTIVIGINTKFN